MAAGRLAVLAASVLLASALAAVLLAAGEGGGEPAVRAEALAAAAATPPPLQAATGGPTPSPIPVPEPTRAPTPAPASSVEEQVEAAYLTYWEAYARAVLQLDASLVEGHAAGAELSRIRAEIARLEAAGVALRVVVEHDALVVVTSDTSAVVVDRLTSRSLYVDPRTLDPPRAEGGGETLRDTVFMERRDGRWVATGSLREGAP